MNFNKRVHILDYFHEEINIWMKSISLYTQRNGYAKYVRWLHDSCINIQQSKVLYPNVYIYVNTVLGQAT